jgi:hypothetical protein
MKLIIPDFVSFQCYDHHYPVIPYAGLYFFYLNNESKLLFGKLTKASHFAY